MRGELQARRDLARILDDAFALYRRHWRTLVAVAAIVVVPVEFGVIGVGLGWLWDGYDANRPYGESVAQLLAQVLVVTPLVTAMVIHVAVDEARRAVAETLRFGFAVFAAVLGASVLAWLGIIAGLLLIVPGVIFAVRWSLVTQVVVVEERRGVSALRRCTELTRGHWWWTLAVLIVLNLVAAVLAAIVTVPARYVADSADAQAIVLVATAASQIFTAPLVALGTTLLFFSLRAGPQAPPAAAPPDDAWEHRRREGWVPPGE